MWSCDLAWLHPQGVLHQLEYQLEQACVEDEKGHLDVAMGLYSRAVETALQGVREQLTQHQLLLLTCPSLPSSHPSHPSPP